MAKKVRLDRITTAHNRRAIMGFVGMGKAHQAADHSCALDAHLNRLFGPTFSDVLEYETKRDLGITLYQAFRDNPSAAVGVLTRIFRKGEAVSLILEHLRVRLSESRSEEDKQIREVFNRAMPLVTPVAD